METRKQRVIFYIDGFNFYFGLKSKKWKQYYWLDIVSFCQSFVKPHQELIEVNYFSAIPKEKGKQDRQDLLFSANKLSPKFNLILGKYLKKTITCYNCKNPINTFEEKQSDVNIAVKMIRDVVLNRADISIIISADSDLTPPFDFVREFKSTHKIFVYFPPNRFSYDLKYKADNYIKLENHPDKFKNAVLPTEITLKNGYVLKRPDKWT